MYACVPGPDTLSTVALILCKTLQNKYINEQNDFPVHIWKLYLNCESNIFFTFNNFVICTTDSNNTTLKIFDMLFTLLS